MKYFKLVLILLHFPIFNSTAQHFIPGHFFYPAIENGKYGFINSTGQWVIKPQYDWCDYFYDGKAIAKEKGKYGFIDVNGEWMAKPIYDTVKHFSEGFAGVGRLSNEERMYWDIIDTAGKYLEIKVSALSNISNFYNGRAIGTEDGFLSFHFFNSKGESAFEIKDFYLDENRISDYSEGLLHVFFGEYRSTFIDTAGNNWGKGDFESCGNFSDGLCWFQESTLFGYFNSSGEIIIPAVYDSTGNFSEGIALVKVKMKYEPNTMKMIDGFVQYIDKEGKKIVPPIYTSGTEFSDGYAMVKYNGMYGFIDKEGKVAIDYQYESGFNFFRGLAYVKKENHWEYINTKGKRVF